MVSSGWGRGVIVLGRVSGILFGDAEGVFSKGVLACMLSKSSKFERLEDGLVLCGDGWVVSICLLAKCPRMSLVCSLCASVTLTCSYCLVLSSGGS